MTTSSDVVLTSTLHDSRGVFLGEIVQASKVVLQNYRCWVINVTKTTKQELKEALRALESQGVYLIEVDENSPEVTDGIERDHLNALAGAARVAETLGASRIQYTDGDRVIIAAIHFPEDLAVMAEKALELTEKKNDYLNFRRSPEDYLTHHPPLVETELEVNRLYSKAFGMPLDVLSTAHVMSLDVVRKIIRRSPEMEPVSFPEPKWLIVAKEMGASIKSEETHHVLTFETPGQFRKEVEEQTGRPTPGSYARLQKDYMATLGLASTLSPKEWELRYGTQGQYLSLLENHLSVLGCSEGEEQRLRGEIEQSLSFAERRKVATIEALRKPVDEIRADMRRRSGHALPKLFIGAERN